MERTAERLPFMVKTRAIRLSKKAAVVRALVQVLSTMEKRAAAGPVIETPEAEVLEVPLFVRKTNQKRLRETPSVLL